MRGILLARSHTGRWKQTWPGTAGRAVSRGVSLRETPLGETPVEKRRIVRNVRTICRGRRCGAPRPSGHSRWGQASACAMIRQMPLPEALQQGIDEVVGRVEGRELERAARSLSERYRGGGAAGSRVARSGADVAAYLATRAPATYAAVEDVCRRIELARPGWSPRSLLDLGAGPGIAAWAAAARWPTIESVTFVEA